MSDTDDSVAQPSRRTFLARMAAAIGVAGASRIASAETPRQRPAFVHLGQQVSYIGDGKFPLPCFIGSTLVELIEPHDGTGYPCRVRSQSYHGRGVVKLMPGIFYDHDLATLHDIPRDVWLREVGPGKRFNSTADLIRSQRGFRRAMPSTEHTNGH